jgi:ubiquinone/menaquinone biosynthesis C-methylase UbiE
MNIEKMGPDAQYIMNLANSYWESSVLFCAIRLNLFDFIEEGGRVFEDIITLLDLNKEKAKMFLNACCSLKLLIHKNNKYYNSEETKMFLRDDSPFSLKDAINYNIQNYPIWNNLIETIKTGKPSMPQHTHLGKNQKKTKLFVKSMHKKAMSMAPIIINYLDLCNVDNLLDVGGCSGSYSYFARQKYSYLNARVFDLPDIVNEGKEIMHKLDPKIEFIKGDYHIDRFPSNQDAVFLFGMLHQEPEEMIKKIIKKAYFSLNKKGKLFVLDVMVEEDIINSKFASLFGLNMALTHETGWVFSNTQLSNWLSQSNFKNQKIISLPKSLPYVLFSAEK